MTRNLLSYAKAFSSGQRHRLEYAIFGKRTVAGPKRSIMCKGIVESRNEVNDFG
jgi:hypothetical protein